MRKRIAALVVVLWFCIAFAISAQGFTAEDLMRGAEACALAKGTTEVSSDVAECVAALAYMQGVIDGADWYHQVKSSVWADKYKPFASDANASADDEYFLKLLRDIYLFYTETGESRPMTGDPGMLVVIHDGLRRDPPSNEEVERNLQILKESQKEK